MIIKIIGLIIGILIGIAGVYYWIKEKDDTESVTIYRSITIVGVVTALVCTVLLAM